MVGPERLRAASKLRPNPIPLETATRALPAGPERVSVFRRLKGGGAGTRDEAAFFGLARGGDTVDHAADNHDFLVAASADASELGRFGVGQLDRDGLLDLRHQPFDTGLLSGRLKIHAPAPDIDRRGQDDALVHVVLPGDGGLRHDLRRERHGEDQGADGGPDKHERGASELISEGSTYPRLMSITPQSIS
ncbi:hypothetical protein EIB18_11885 [Caulobacter vibrioides]|uniref:Uncharacterized protein n=1 Tax=Caulobacter vibrioides (strain ATCC 19089 / CIP 103742 / CB 15) TaxID=190650 RepID=Q9A654_CAUVC|nr:hypothetical protein CC_2240 [Caulobacter vibrioides CB15]ATC25244.1 hypothetical protein CA608_12230 [Caulobacter vibrioides]ATC29104.1 hypothetical protein CA607_12185 [Caulobacter vibrioides]AZH13341.1 hypothetical protein EIB18_11885 [Caulobacter vibrioides]PLR14014.1 hypothetical protein CVUC_05530 [Caulobacter vibrioides]